MTTVVGIYVEAKGQRKLGGNELVVHLTSVLSAKVRPGCVLYTCVLGKSAFWMRTLKPNLSVKVRSMDVGIQALLHGLSAPVPGARVCVYIYIERERERDIYIYIYMPQRESLQLSPL